MILLACGLDIPLADLLAGPMSRATGDRDLEARVEALRRKLTALIVTLSNAGQRLEDLADELRSRRRADKEVALDRRRRGKGRG